MKYNPNNLYISYWNKEGLTEGLMNETEFNNNNKLNDLILNFTQENMTQRSRIE